MAVDSRISLFTTKMRTEFQVAYQATAVPLKFEKFTQIIPSTARIEHYTWMSPSPGIAQYAGHRRYGKIDAIRYSRENLEFDAAFEVLLRDIEDDQTSGYELKPKELAERAKKFPGRWVVKQAANGANLPCFDGTNFFANSHEIGTGDNLLAQTGTGNSDGLTYKFLFFHTGGPLKPLLWQDRKPPRFMTNSGESRSFESKQVRFWVDLEGQMAFGYWYDGVMVSVTNQITSTDAHTMFSNVETAFRSFQLPKSLTSEDGEYIHEQADFNSGNLFVIGPTSASEALRQALAADWMPQSVGNNTVAVTNRFKGFADWTVSAFLNPS